LRRIIGAKTTGEQKVAATEGIQKGETKRWYRLAVFKKETAMVELRAVLNQVLSWLRQMTG
jgi:hypothetical protein